MGFMLDIFVYHTFALLLRAVFSLCTYPADKGRRFTCPPPSLSLTCWSVSATCLEMFRLSAHAPPPPHPHIPMPLLLHSFAAGIWHEPQHTGQWRHRRPGGCIMQLQWYQHLLVVCTTLFLAPGTFSLVPKSPQSLLHSKEHMNFLPNPHHLCVAQVTAVWAAVHQQGFPVTLQQAAWWGSRCEPHRQQQRGQHLRGQKKKTEREGD
jgi:hypothetical protein